ncbi:MAG: methyltransferase domain-containing protein [Deltaproteobacteria bacterium]|nr:methyltransferase domain-containing protein [Deltaproteobacteria bacterium]
MIRNCFICHTDMERLFSSQWALPGLPSTEIGFSICPACGTVAQSPTVTFEEMMTYYDSIAVYTNPGRQEKPSDTKVRDLDEQVQFVKRAMGRLPQSTLQIGSSDGYTLSRFKEAGVDRVLGVEPGRASVEIAKRLYDVESIPLGIEDFHTDERFELIILTHVLEHLYSPVAALLKCRELQSNQRESFLFVEVPLLGLPGSLFPGFFAFEHINCFTRANLIRAITDAGYFPISVLEHYTSNMSPIIGVMASTKAQHHLVTAPNEYNTNKTIVTTYRDNEIRYWQDRLDTLTTELSDARHVYIWGAGIHTSQLVANTNLLEKYTITGLTDGSSLKWGLKQGDWMCERPDAISWQPGDRLIISSYASEKEIFDALDWLRQKGVTTLRLHHVDNPKSH